jgi:hypothetical protein
VVRRLDPRLRRPVESFPLAVAPPEFVRAGKLVQRQRGLDLGAGAGAVVEQETVTVGAEHEGHAERIGVVQRLLHPGADWQRVDLGLDHRQRQVGLVVEDEVGAAGLAAAVELAAHDDAAAGEGDFLAHLAVQIPAGLHERRDEVLGADVPLGQRLLVRVHVNSPCVLAVDPLRRRAWSAFGGFCTACGRAG